jgi:hypothetical protein
MDDDEAPMVAPVPEQAKTTEGARRTDRLEVVATVLLAVAAVATAWSSYQAMRWNGEQARAASRTTALRIEAARADGLSDSQTEVDVATFIQWIDATARDDADLQEFYENRFRPEFSVAFDAWMETGPLTTPGAPLTPFAMDDYQTSASVETERLDEASAASSEMVTRDIQRASNYVLAVVLMSVSLFFAGISTKLRTHQLRVITLAVGCTLFVGTAAWIASFPISISV